MNEIPTEEENALKSAWKQHFDAMHVIHRHLEKDGGSIQIDIVVRDKAETDKYAKRKAAAKKRMKSW